MHWKQGGWHREQWLWINSAIRHVSMLVFFGKISAEKKKGEFCYMYFCFLFAIVRIQSWGAVNLGGGRYGLEIKGIWGSMQTILCVTMRVCVSKSYFIKLFLWFFKLRRISKHGMTDSSYSNRIPDWTCRSLIGTCGPCGTDTNLNEK